MKTLFFILTTWACLVFAPNAFAQTNPTESIEASVIEKRARDIGQSLRCVVCQNQSIDESDAPLAEDMRKLVRQRLSEGDSNADVINYMRDKYGDYVLLKPPVQNNTYVLWSFPFLLLLCGLIWFFLTGRKTSDPIDSSHQEASS